jgi:hypothetical protein
MLPVVENGDIETVKVLEPLTAFDAAPIKELPTPTAVARPVTPIVATLESDVVHIALVVKSWVLLSVYVPVAMNCFVDPKSMDGFAGVTVIETSLGVVTVSVVEPVTTPDAA